MDIRTVTAAAMTAVSLIALPSQAQLINDSFTYQGSLQDEGTPANGLYDITFIVYDAEVAGSAVPGGTHTVVGVEVVDGLFTTEVDFGLMAQIFESTSSRWLELRVSESGQPGTTILEPRQKITPAPLANYALRSGTTLQDAYDNADSLELGLDGLRIHAVPLSHSGISIRLPLVGERAFFGTSSDGSGQLIVHGQFGSIFLDPQLDGDDTVRVPVDSLNATEILNEPGIAEVENGFGSTTLTPDPSVIDVIESVSINSPNDGFVFVIASCEVTVTHPGTANTFANFGVSQFSDSLPSNADVELRIEGDLPNGFYDYPVTVHGVFPVNEGLNTFYFLGDQNSTTGTMLALDMQLTAIYIPTAYGAVSRSSYADIPDGHLPVVPSKNNYQILEERNAALRADLNRQQREIEEMRAMVKAMKAQLDQSQDEEKGN